MIYFIRHGERKEQVYRLKHGERKFKDMKIMSQIDREKYLFKLERMNFNDKLTKNGTRETRKFCELLKNLNIDVIYTSPYLRCIETANIISTHLNIPFIVENGLRERKSYNAIRYFENEKFNLIWNNYLNYNFKTTEIEDCYTFIERVRKTIMKINNENIGKNVLIVSHSCLTYALNAIVNGIPEDGFICHDKIDNNIVREFDVNYNIGTI